MYNASNPIILDENTVFFDNKKIYYRHRRNRNNIISTFRNNWLYDLDAAKKNELYNCLNKNTMYINLFVGLNSSYSMNNMINSNIYKNDEKVKSNKFTAFKEDKEYKGNNLDTNLNPLLVSTSYGLKNPDDLFEIVDNEPFEDTDNIENVEHFFGMSNEMKYPKYFNHYSISRLNANISVFGTIEEIDGSMLTERSLKGIKCEIIKSGMDARERAVNFSDSITLLEMNSDENNNSIQKYSIESYSDEEYQGIVTGNDELLKRSFSYTTKIINGQAVTVFDTTNSASSLIPRMTNKIIFYTEDDNSIAPFVDRNIIPVNSSNHSSNNEYNTGNVYPSHGRDNDNSQGSGPDSFSFGDID